MSNTLADIDEVQDLGSTALTTLTQLWRQLPRLDSEASKKLSDDVVAARKAIERLVKIGCESHTRPRDLEDRLYQPLPFQTEHQRHHHHSHHHRAVSTGGASDSSSQGSHRRRSSFPTMSTPSKLDNQTDNVGGNNNNNDNTNNNNNYTNTNSNDRDSSNVVIDLSAQPASEDVLMRDYDKFKRELNLPPGLNWYDDPGWAEILQSYQRMHHVPLSRMTLIVQLAMRREFLWRLHARQLQCQSDRDTMGELETRGRCDIAVECSEEREGLLAAIQGVVQFGADDESSVESRRARVFANIRSSFEREREKVETIAKMAKLEEEKRKMVEEMSKLSAEVTKLSKEHVSLHKKASAPSQTIPPEQLSKLISEISHLRRQVEAQENDLQAMGI